jgi:hypothetical protein
VRNPGEWQRIPADRLVRVVYLIDDLGPAIRWVDNDRTQSQGEKIVFHADLENGDGHNSARSGYLRRRLDGKIEIL